MGPGNNTIEQDTVKAKDLVETLVRQLLVRNGEVMTQELAYERARNIAQGLVGVTEG